MKLNRRILNVGFMARAATAALRFCAARHAVRPAVWRPVALHWHVMRSPSPPISGYGTQVTNNMWAQHLQLHLVVHTAQTLSAIVRAAVWPHSALAGTASQSRHVLELRRSIIESSNIRTLWQNTTQQFRGAASPRTSGDVVRARPVHSRRTGMAVLSWHAEGNHDTRRTHGAAFPVVAAAVGAQRGSGGRMGAVWSGFYFHRPHLQMTNYIRMAAFTERQRHGPAVTTDPRLADRPHTAAAMILTLTSQLRAQTASDAPDVVPRVLMQRQELIWRDGEKDAAPARLPKPGDLTGPPQSRANSGHGVTTQTTHPGPVANAPALLKLDESLISRMTDDVIRKVERRARLDRARRGV